MVLLLTNGRVTDSHSYHTRNLIRLDNGQFFIFCHNVNFLFSFHLSSVVVSCRVQTILFPCEYSILLTPQYQYSNVLFKHAVSLIMAITVACTVG